MNIGAVHECAERLRKELRDLMPHDSPHSAALYCSISYMDQMLSAYHTERENNG